MIGVLIADETVDLLVLVPLIAAAMMVWEALSFSGEMSEYHSLEDEAAEIDLNAALIDTELKAIADELARREREGG